MFRELSMLRELRRLLKQRRFSEVLALARNPAISEHRKAVLAAEEARAGLLRSAEDKRDGDDPKGALEDLGILLRDREEAAALRVEAEVLSALERRRAVREEEAPRSACDAPDTQSRQGAPERGVGPPTVSRLEGSERGDSPLSILPRFEGPGTRPVVFRSIDEVEGGAGSLVAGLPFVLRIEEHGDWFAHPGSAVVIGNATRGVSDLPILAAIGSRHARIERRGEGAGARYQVVPAPGKKVTRNRRPVLSAAELTHGDILELGQSLSMTFLRPVADSATALLELGGDFSVNGCRRVLLFSEQGRRGSIVLGPGPHAHVAMAPSYERVEILRDDTPEVRGELLARSPRGIAVDGGADRAQVRVAPRAPVRAGQLSFFVDPV